jgi:DMSO/TMAO reductase YedYZ molybdopterin-dependent catalytic subunit
MRGITIRLVVASIVAGAFVVTALSGVVLYRPVRLLPAFGISLLTWRPIHDWGALVLTAAVIVHLILHRRRVGQMIAGLARPARSPQITAAPVVGGPQESARAAPPEPTTSEAHPEARHLRVTRRRFLIGFGALLAGFAGAFVAVEALFRGGGGARRTAASGRVPGSSSFPTLEVEAVPHVPPEQWVVTVDGLVDKPLRLDHAAWAALTRRSETADFHCVEGWSRHTETADFHCVEGWSVDRLRWGGVAPRTLLDMAGLQPTATHVNFHALGGTYADSLPLGLVDDAQTVLADTLDEQPLPDAHGGPLRLVVPKQLGYKNVKWVVRLEVTDHPVTGYWEHNGYPMDAPAPSG